MSGTAIVWFRRDLRLADHPALHAAVSSGRRVIALYIHSPEESAPWSPGGASNWWLHHSLQALDASLRQLGSRLIIRRGGAAAVLEQLCKESGADAVYWSRQYEAAHVARDRAIKADLRGRGLSAESYAGSLLSEPWQIRTGAGEVYRVFSPYWRNLSARLNQDPPLPPPTRLDDPQLSSLPLAELGLLPRIGWDAQFSTQWQPGEAGAHAALDLFQDAAARDYAEGRNRPDQRGTSALSPHLHFGEISPRQIIHLLCGTGSNAAYPNRQWEQQHAFIRELGWRDFAYQLLHNFPHTSLEPLYPQWASFPWRESDADVRAWQRGQTGIPIIDAGMRQLWQHGWMHNRVRMIVASFLCKNLRLHWLHGARWFWDTLLDADLASNTLGWQWSAGCGADAAPYFRVFNPVSQAEKFDPQGDYVRRFVPELQRLSGKAIHQPWLVGGMRGYPKPLVDLKQSRADALAAFAQFRGKSADTAAAETGAAASEV
jgi:deoxyribodipyrimidine photo-lyase